MAVSICLDTRSTYSCSRFKVRIWLLHATLIFTCPSNVPSRFIWLAMRFLSQFNYIDIGDSLGVRNGYLSDNHLKINIQAFYQHWFGERFLFDYLKLTFRFPLLSLNDSYSKPMKIIQTSIMNFVWTTKVVKIIRERTKDSLNVIISMWLRMALIK